MVGGKDHLHSWREIAWIAALAFVSVCLVSSNIWENGDIEAKWWAAKAWADGQFPQFQANHHNLRWAITLPASLWIMAFGGGALSYLLLNHLVFAAATAALYAVIRALTTRLIALIAFAVWMINPLTQSLPSNLMPEIYSIAYVTLAILLLLRAYASGSRWTYAAAIAVMFLAYGAKETNIFFMPGLGLYELWRRRWINVAIICGVFGAMLVAETVAINVILSESHLMFGRYEATVQGGHLDEMGTAWVYQPIQLLTRWLWDAETNLDRLEYYNKLIYWAFFILSFWAAWRWLRARTWLPPASAIGPNAAPGGEAISASWAMGLAYAFCTAFFILDLDPLTLGQPLNDRYIWPLLPPAMIVLSVALKAAVDHAKAGSVLSRAQKLAEPLSLGRAGLVSLALIAGFATLTRAAIEFAIVEIRRDGFEQPYTTLTVAPYFAEARRQILDGCTIVSPRQRPVRAVLTQAFPHHALTPSEQVLSADLDGLQIESRTLHVWPLPREDWPLFEGKLYFDPSLADFQPFAFKLEGGQCEAVYYWGHGDMHPRNQHIEGRVAAPTD